MIVRRGVGRMSGTFFLRLHALYKIAETFNNQQCRIVRNKKHENKIL